MERERFYKYADSSILNNTLYICLFHLEITLIVTNILQFIRCKTFTGKSREGKQFLTQCSKNFPDVICF